MSNDRQLTELVKARVDPATKRALAAEAKRTDRTEGAVVRLALREHLAKRRS